MSEILVLVEHSDGAVKKVTLELLTLARSLGTPAAVWLGAGCSDAAVATLGEYGADKVYVADSAELDDFLVAPKAEAMARVLADSQAAAVLIPSTAEGKEIAGRLAIKAGSGVITDAVGVAADLSATQSVFGGSTVVTSKVSTGTPIITVRPNSVAPEPAAGAAARVDVTVDISDAAKSARVTDRTVARKGGRPELSEAAIVVSGGRGVGEGGFGPLEELAALLGGAVGCSRVVTSAGWRPHAEQVGQTGTKVAPDLYIAVGISGATQHIAGCKNAKTMIAINTDPDATIMSFADYAVIGDAATVMPALVEAVRAAKG